MNSCTKKTFETEREAQDRATEINKENGTHVPKREKRKRSKPPKNGGVRMRAYPCERCGKFHISSMSKSDYNKIVDQKKGRFIAREARRWMDKLGLNS